MTTLPSSIKSLVTSLGLPWFEIFGELWKVGRQLMRGLASEGMYEVLDYESTLEIHDPLGKRATYEKRKHVRYLQDNIIAYQDYAWGDGKILLSYKTNIGKAVDRYRSGFKTYMLLSLREIKNRGDLDDYHIQWNIRDGFLTEDGYWSTHISNRTRKLKVKVIFPKSRIPRHYFLEESNRQRSRDLGKDSLRRLSDGRWQLTWEMHKPRLYEVYVLRWIW